MSSLQRVWSGPGGRRRVGILALGVAFLIAGIVQALTRSGPSAAHATVTRTTPSADGVTLALSCAGATCSGTLTLTAHERRRGARVVAVNGSAAGHAVVVGRGVFSIVAGASGTPSATLNATGRALRSRFGRLPVTITLTLRERRGRGVATTHATIG
jgi:hypothetical protein